MLGTQLSPGSKLERKSKPVALMPRTRKSASKRASPRLDLPAILFDLDGTLIDSNYHHVATWSEALRSAGIIIPNWKIHRRIGMSGKSFLRELFREIPPPKGKVDLEQLERKHDALFRSAIVKLVPLPGANELLRHLADNRLRIAIATTGGKSQTSALLRHLEIPGGTQIVTGDDVQRAKPSPDVFVLAAQRLNTALRECIVVGDSSWDMLAAARKRALGVGLLSGGYGEEDLERAGAFRVYSDPADMLMHLEQLGLPGT
jgi:HAD superfamily hydrolase (TIGR01509 family)